MIQVFPLCYSALKPLRTGLHTLSLSLWYAATVKIIPQLITTASKHINTLQSSHRENQIKGFYNHSDLGAGPG